MALFYQRYYSASTKGQKMISNNKYDTPDKSVFMNCKTSSLHLISTITIPDKPKEGITLWWGSESLALHAASACSQPESVMTQLPNVSSCRSSSKHRADPTTQTCWLGLLLQPTLHGYTVHTNLFHIHRHKQTQYYTKILFLPSSQGQAWGSIGLT